MIGPGIVKLIDRPNSQVLVQMPSDTMPKPEVYAGYRGDPPWPMSYVDLEQVSATQYRCTGPIGNKESIIEDDFTNLFERAGKPVSASVQTIQSTGSGAYTNLATTGPSVTLVTGTEVLITLDAKCRTDTAGTAAWMSVDVSGATTIAAADANSIENDQNNVISSFSRTFKLTGLNAGTNTFTAKYKVVVAGVALAYFEFRDITVTPLWNDVLCDTPWRVLQSGTPTLSANQYSAGHGSWLELTTGAVNGNYAVIGKDPNQTWDPDILTPGTERTALWLSAAIAPPGFANFTGEFGLANDLGAVFGSNASARFLGLQMAGTGNWKLRGISGASDVTGSPVDTGANSTNTLFFVLDLLVMWGQYAAAWVTSYSNTLQTTVPSRVSGPFFIDNLARPLTSTPPVMGLTTAAASAGNFLVDWFKAAMVTSIAHPRDLGLAP